MNCHETQDQILTGYFDGQLTDGERKSVDQHLGTCARCEEFARLVKETVIQPFTQLEPRVPPETVWRSIEERIDSEPRNQPSGWLHDLLEKVGILFPAPRPALAVLSVLVLTGLMMVLSPMRQPDRQAAEIDTQEQIEYLASLIEEDDNSILNDNGDYGTGIEEYFL